MLCPNTTTVTVPVPSVVEILVDYTSTGTFITTSVHITSVTTYITERAVSACVLSTFNILAAAPAAAPTPDAGAPAVADGNASRSSQAAGAAAAAAAAASAAASNEPLIDINDGDIGSIPEPASEPWDF